VEISELEALNHTRAPHLNDFLPEGVRAVDVWMAYWSDDEGCESFHNYMEKHYAESLLVYLTARRIVTGGR
jgi:hypothetical protein